MVPAPRSTAVVAAKEPDCVGCGRITISPAIFGKQIFVSVTNSRAKPMTRARLRDLGLRVGSLPPGPFNAITDVAGVKVGYSTVIQNKPRTARTGVTAIWPRGREIWSDYVFAGTFSFNGNGEMTGLPWLAEQGLLGAPISITNTYQV